ncbi:MAG: TIM-barrel domain-containing protein [Rhodospirillales bacterium]
MRTISSRLLSAAIVMLLLPGLASAAVERRKFTAPGGYLVVEVLDDDLIRFEASAVGAGPSTGQPLYTSPMVFKTDYAGPSTFVDAGGVLETADIRIEVNAGNLCATVKDKTRGAVVLTTFCPVGLAQVQTPKGLNIDPAGTRHVYGLGQQFKHLGSADGDWLAHGVREGLNNLGNGFQGFQNAAVGNVQIPVYYAVGDGGLNYAVMLDNVYWQKWDFEKFWWEVRMFGDQVRWYVMTGPDLPDLRADFMELTGRPPVPPRKSFGLWVSEFGYDNWGQIDALLAGLRAADFPVDGFVLDLNWFGGIVLGDASQSNMGRLDWDEDQALRNLATNPYSFPDPATRVAAYAADHVGITTIEESYLATPVMTFHQMPVDLGAYRRTAGACDAGNQTVAVDDVSGFWGVGRMVDWTDPQAGKWIHDNRRHPNMTAIGVTAHWTDLGEPENFDPAACYEGVETTATGRKNTHADIHNLYNLLWNRSIWEGYFDKRTPQGGPRPFVLSRSGAAGLQRYGVAMWSGDIASHLESLATHSNAQMHMSLSGIDYYGADIGGFRREVMPHNNKNGDYRGFQDELYTQWFANGAWFDVPVRPHVDNEFNQAQPPYDTAPHLVGKVPSNLANLRQRYELIPYYYSLAHLAHATGAPLMPPPVFHYQDDPNLRGVGNQKMIGRDLMVAIVAGHGEYQRDVYLPAGRWTNYHSNEWVSGGTSLGKVPVYRGGILRLPAFVRAGAILPKMTVDAGTKDAFGARKAGAPRDELIVRVYADPTASAFTLFEDDGTTLGYTADGRPTYHHRTTRIGQQRTAADRVTVTIAGAVDAGGSGAYAGAPSQRQNVVELVVDDAEATTVSLDNVALVPHATRADFEAASSGWVNAGRNLILAKSAARPVADAKTFVFTLRPAAATTSVNFVCDRGFTRPGQSVYVVGSTPELGSWDTAKALRLDPSIYWEYIYSPPPGGPAPGPGAPVWTGVVSGLPPAPTFEWKCIRRNEDGTGAVDWQPGANNAFAATVASGYAGQAYGTF